MKQIAYKTHTAEGAPGNPKGDILWPPEMKSPVNPAKSGIFSDFLHYRYVHNRDWNFSLQTDIHTVTARTVHADASGADVGARE